MKTLTLPQAYGKILRQRRRKQGLTQEQLAQDAGLTRSFIYNLETGQRQPTLGTIVSLASALGTTPNEMVDSAQVLFMDNQ